METERIEFYKENKNDHVWWATRYLMQDDEMTMCEGEHLFSFDRKKLFNLFRDYPHALTAEQKELFDKENPYWADFFKDRG